MGGGWSSVLAQGEKADPDNLISLSLPRGQQLSGAQGGVAARRALLHAEVPGASGTGGGETPTHASGALALGFVLEQEGRKQDAIAELQTAAGGCELLLKVV